MSEGEVMDTKEMLVRYDGVPIDKGKLSDFEQSTLGFFHDRNFVDNPHIQMTLQFDITEAEKVYRQKFSSQPNATLTAYLTWRLLQTLNNYPTLQYRHIEGQWYKFGNLPLFFNVALKNSIKLRDVVVENASKMKWLEFCVSYYDAVYNAMNSKNPFVPSPLYNLGTVICNLPTLSFTQFGIHQLRSWHGRPVFYFGRRYHHDDRLLMPLFVQLDHSNGDPILLDALLNGYECVIKNTL